MLWEPRAVKLSQERLVLPISEQRKLNKLFKISHFNIMEERLSGGMALVIRFM